MNKLLILTVVIGVSASILTGCITAPTSDMTKEEAEDFINQQRIELACVSGQTAILAAKVAKPDMNDNQRAVADAAVAGLEAICQPEALEGKTAADVLRAINLYLTQLEQVQRNAR